MKYKIRKRLSIEHNGRKLYRIQALKNIEEIGVKKGDLGGYVESEHNLSQEGNCWIGGEAKIYDLAVVEGNATIDYKAEVFERARVSGDCYITDNAKIRGMSKVWGKAEIFNNVEITDFATVGGNVRLLDEVFLNRHTWVNGDIVIKGKNGNFSISSRSI